MTRSFLLGHDPAHFFWAQIRRLSFSIPDENFRFWLHLLEPKGSSLVGHIYLESPNLTRIKNGPERKEKSGSWPDPFLQGRKESLGTKVFLKPRQVQVPALSDMHFRKSNPLVVG